MQAAAIPSLVRYFSPLRLAGPLFGKELRVASRRQRYYLLRFAYVCLLCGMMLSFWHSIARVGGGTSGVAQVARLGEVGQRTIVMVVWFQFITAQVLAVVLLSDAISGEMRRRTLEDLLVTPMGAVHIALGKLLSRLLQLILLLAISLPVLALARVFGGVPWDYVVSSLCITLSASVFAGSLSLLCSILHHNAPRAVLTVGFWYVALWGLDAFVLMLLPQVSYVGNGVGASLWSLVSPFHALFIRTQAVLVGPTAASPFVSVTLHCLTMLTAAGIVLALSARRVGRIILASAYGRTEGWPGSATAHQTDLWSDAQSVVAGRAMRRVRGAPIVWKDLYISSFQARSQSLYCVGLWFAVGGLALVAVTLAKPAVYGSFLAPILILQGLFIIRLGTAAAGAITREKEARTWPILVTTPLDDSEIVKGKAIAALRRNLSLLIPLLGLYPVAFVFGRPGERDLSHIVLCVGGPIVNLLATALFLIGCGLYLSVRCRRTMVAVASTFGAYFLSMLAFGVPLTLFSMASPGMLPQDLSGRGVFLSALFSMASLGILPQGSSSDRRMYACMVLFAIVYGCGGRIFLREAARRLRRDVF
jgi:ABC-type transport system involved in multi-copper enzyme maturation permease subunit